jgi:hypothetical protein
VHNLKDSRWFGTIAPFAEVEEKTAHVAPGYPYLVYWVEKSPIDLGASHEQMVRWAQCALDEKTTCVLWYVGLSLKNTNSRAACKNGMSPVVLHWRLVSWPFFAPELVVAGGKLRPQ